MLTLVPDDPPTTGGSATPIGALIAAALGGWGDPTAEMIGNRAVPVASLTNVRTAIWSGGVLCVAAIGGVSLLLPGLARFTDVADPQDPALHVGSDDFG